MRALLIRAAAVLTALAFVAPAAAQDSPPPPPPDDSAITQYVEVVPAAGGTKAPGVGKRSKPRPLSRAVRTQLRTSGGADAPALKQLATSPELGASARPKRPRHTVIRPSEDRSSPSGSISAAVTAVGEGGGVRFALLGLALIGITGTVLASARRRLPAS